VNVQKCAKLGSFFDAFEARLVYRMISQASCIVRSVGLPSLRSNLFRFSSSASGKMIEETIVTKLTSAFAPVHMEVVNESYKHNVPKGAESHFKVLVVSELFENKKMLERHRLVNNVLAEELGQGAGGGGIHALSIQAKIPSQFNTGNAEMHSTPNCAGGDAGNQMKNAAAADGKESSPS